MTDVEKRLEEIRKRAEKAAVGPLDIDSGGPGENCALWSSVVDDPALGEPRFVAEVNGDFEGRNSAFFANAREDTLWLLAELEKARDGGLDAAISILDAMKLEAHQGNCATVLLSAVLAIRAKKTPNEEWEDDR